MATEEHLVSQQVSQPLSSSGRFEVPAANLPAGTGGGELENDAGAGRTRAESGASQAGFARHGSTTSSEFSWYRSGSASSVASAGQSNRVSLLCNEAALEEVPEQEPDSPVEPFKHQQEPIEPLPAKGSHTFSRPVPEYVSTIAMQLDHLQFLLKTISSHLEQVTIPDMEKVLSQESTTINCPPFTADHHQYKLCPQVRLDRANVSFSIAIMKGDWDRRLTWPFPLTVILRVINKSGGHHKEKMFRCVKNRDRLKECLSKPKGVMNPAMGYPRFMSRQSLEKDGFIRNNCMHLECYLFPRDVAISHPSEVPSMIR